MIIHRLNPQFRNLFGSFEFIDVLGASGIPEMFAVPINIFRCHNKSRWRWLVLVVPSYKLVCPNAMPMLVNVEY
jgi:hypothetical protein